MTSQPGSWASPGPQDALAAFRKRLLYWLASAGVVFLLPFSIVNLLQGNLTAGLGMLSCVIVLLIDAAAIYFDRRPPLPLWLLVIPVVPVVAISMQSQGFYVVLWCYPTVLFLAFALPRRLANICGAAILIIVGACVYRYIGTPEAVRFFITLLLSIILVNIVLIVLGEMHTQMSALAITDPLTGAFNRRHMAARLSEAIERDRRSHVPASLLLVDIDHFKRINDELGHAAGDRVLQGLVALIIARARKTDLLFRIGGEEFILYLPDTRLAAACSIAETLRAAAEQTSLLPDRRVTVSVGVSELHPGESLDSWMKHADEALYQAKNAGRNRVVSRDGPPSELPIDPVASRK